MFVLLQVYPLEPAGDDDEAPLDVVAVAATEDELARYLAAYEPRYQAACREFDVWADGRPEDWSEDHDRMFAEVATWHGVYGALVSARFEILESHLDAPLVPARAA
jgi:hypothetical protein